jgi:hypothetical protein
MRPSRSALAALLAAALAAACTSSPVTGVSASDRMALSTARARWASRGIDSYDWVWQRGWCECLPEWTRPLYVEVRDGEVRTMVDAETRQAPTGFGDVPPPTVEYFFSVIEDAIARNAYRLTVRYDPSDGHPTFLQVDYDEQMVDDELRIETRQFTPR